MSQFNPMALPQGRTGVALTLKIAASLGATASVHRDRIPLARVSKVVEPCVCVHVYSSCLVAQGAGATDQT